MKIKKAINIINNKKNISTVVAKESYSSLRIYSRNTKVDFNWFLRIPINATNWNSIDSDWTCLFNINPQDLTRVMDVVQQPLDTPIEERFSEKKYYLRWIDDKDNHKNYLYLNSDCMWNLVNEFDATLFTESELEQLKKNNPRFASTIDIMKEPAEDKNND